jgi:hypothetical protein
MLGTFAQQYPWGASPAGLQGIGTFPGSPHSQPFGQNIGFSQSQQPLQHIVQSLQFVPQQLQQIVQLAYAQAQHAQYLQQVVVHQLQQIQPLLTQAGFQTGIPQQSAGNPFQQIPPGVTQAFGGQPGYIM